MRLDNQASTTPAYRQAQPDKLRVTLSGVER